MKTKLFYLALAALFTLMSCHKDDETFESKDISTFTAEVVQEIQSSIVGYVYDENNEPVVDASVLIYSTQAKTDKNGLFIIDNARMDKQGTYIKVYKDGYILGSDFVYPQKNTTTYSYTKLLALSKNKSFTASDGGTIEASGGGKIIFPAQSIVRSNGEVFNGKVFVTAKYLDPQATDLSDKMPGGLMADAANGNTVILGTLGMMAVELRDDAGNELQLDPLKPAEVQFPIRTSTAPETIQLWSFDENKGRWKEEGIATKTSDFYVAKVSHFSFWNCDAPFPLVEVCGRVVDEQGNPIPNVQVAVQAEGLGVAYGYTDSEGNYCGKMPKNAVLKITFNKFNYCNQEGNSITVGPFTTNTTLSDFVFVPIDHKILEGTVVCNGTPVTSGLVVVNINGVRTIFSTNENGAYRIDFSTITCESTFEAKVFGLDRSTSKTSPEYTVASDNFTVLNINVCEVSCDFDVELKFDCDSRIDAIVSNGSGDYSYTWSTGSSDAYIVSMDSLFQVFCVTVTDNQTTCTSIACNSFQAPEGFIRTNCDNGELIFSNTINDDVTSYSWSNGSTTKATVASAPGTYCVTVTYKNLECKGEFCVEYSGQLYVDNSPISCNFNMYEFGSSPFSYGYATAQPGIELFLSYPLQINVFDIGGFKFELLIASGQCFAETEVELPRFEGVFDTNIRNTSCSTCNDGQFDIESDPSGSCINCTYGDIKIFKTNDLTNDLSSVNDAGMMPKGSYYLVLTDQNTGCVIAFREVEIK